MRFLGPSQAGRLEAWQLQPFWMVPGLLRQGDADGKSALCGRAWFGADVTVRRPSLQPATDLRFSIWHPECCKSAQATLPLGTFIVANRSLTSCERLALEEQRLGDVAAIAYSRRNRRYFFLRKRSITSPTSAPTCAHSSSRIFQSKLNRTHARARASSTPIAVKIFGAVIDPEEQADP